MTLKELKELIEKEVSESLGSSITEPELPKKKIKPREKISEEELDNFIFYGQQKAHNYEELPRTKSHL